MATPAAILGILVKASTSEANLALAKTDAQLNATAASAERTTAATSTAGATMKKMGTMAKFAGAAIAVGFVIEAKKAVAVTQDLTKSTISLHENLGIANKEASKWAAVAKARGVDTTKLGMAFKTFATQVDSANKGSATSIKMFRDLGITQKELADGQDNVQKLILQTADGIDQLGAGTQRTTAESKLFGRGWQTVAPLIRDGSGALKENLDLTEKYGATLQGQTLKAQEELLANTRESKLAWMGLQVSLSNFVTPALNDLQDQFQKIARIQADPKLTADEKWKKTAAIISKDLTAAMNAVVEVIPTLASRVGEQAPKIAAAFVQGFFQADAWGKLALGAWFFTKIGLTATVMKAAAGRLAAVFGATFAAESTAAAGAAGGGAGLLGALAIPAAGVGALALGLDKLTKAREEAGQAQIEIVKNAGEFQKTLDTMKASYGSLTKAVGAMSKKQQEQFIQTAQTLADQGAMDQKAVYNLQQAVVDSTERQQKAWHKLGDALGTTAAKVKENTGSMARSFINDLSSMGETNKSVLKAIQDDTNKALKAFGVSEVQFAVSSRRAHPHDVGQARQRGGMIGGSGSGDRVHVMAEPGEGFINKTAVKALGGKGAIDAINSAVPRFQTGGFVGMQPGIVSLVKNVIGRFGGAMSSGYRPGDPGFHGRGMAADWVGGDWTGASRYINSIGPSLLEGIHQAPPGSQVSWDSGHQVPPSFWGPSTWAAHTSHIHMAISGAVKAMGAAVEQIKRQVIGGPDGPWKNLLQASADKVRGAANRYIGKQMPSASFDTAAVSGGGTLSPAQFLSIAGRAIGVTGTRGSFNTQGLLSLAMQESGLRVNPPPPHDINWPANPSMGLMQITGSNFKTYHETGTSGSIIDPLANIAASINYQLGRYGHQVTFSPYARGGVVPSFAGGGTVPGPIGAPRAAIVHGGERISPAGRPHVEINLYGDASALLEDVEVLIDGKVPDIAEYTLREGGRNRARSRQLAGQAGRS